MTTHCMGQQRSAGFVLVTVLVFTLVATLLSLATLRNIHLAQQQIAQHEKSLREQAKLQDALVARSERIDMDSTRILQTSCVNDTSASAITLRATTLRAGITPHPMTLLYVSDVTSLTDTASCPSAN